MKDYSKERYFLKSFTFTDLEEIETDQGKKIPEPPLQKSCNDKKLIELITPQDFQCGTMDLLTILKKRRSRRVFSKEALTLEELSYLLWSAQGVKKIVKNGYATLRTTPSAGARHPFETYIIVFNVLELEKGLYRYLPLEHKMVFEKSIDNLEYKLNKATFDQNFVSRGAATFVFTAIPYRSEWRYDTAAHKCIALDAGHLCENLYLAAESIDCGTCAIAAYDQELMDELLGVDGEEEFTIYLAPIGKQNSD